MEQNTMISNALDYNDYKKAYDNYCKLILHNKQIVSRILKEVIPEYKNLSYDEISDLIDDMSTKENHEKTEQFNSMNCEDESILGSKVIFDVKFEAKLPDDCSKAGVIINLEAQGKDMSSYSMISRGIYYACRLIDEQRGAANGFQKSEFNKLKKVYSIWFVINPKLEKRDSVNVYSIQEQCIGKRNQWKAPKEEYDLLTVVMYYLNSEYEYEDEDHSLLEMLNILLIEDMSAKEKKEKLHNNYGIIITKEIDEEVDTMCNVSEAVADRRELKVTIQHLQIIMAKMHLNLTDAMNMLNVKEHLRPDIIRVFEKKEKEKVKMGG